MKEKSNIRLIIVVIIITVIMCVSIAFNVYVIIENKKDKHIETKDSIIYNKIILDSIEYNIIQQDSIIKRIEYEIETVKYKTDSINDIDAVKYFKELVMQ